MRNKSSIDTDEVAKFSRLSEKWWDEEGEFKLLHLINPLRLKFITDKIKTHFSISNHNDLFSKLNLLDVGCGGGLVSIPLAQLGINITSIDASYENIKVATSHARENSLNINFLNTTVEELNIESNKFDVIVCLEVIEHIINIENFIQNLANLLKPNGVLILSTISRSIKSYLQIIFMAEYILKWIPKKTHNFNKFLKPSELNALLVKNNLFLRELKGLKFMPINQTWYLCEQVDVNYFAYAIKVDD